MTGSILWYIHDHGTGHLQRARAVVPRVAADVVVAAGPGVHEAAWDTFGPATVRLPSDVPPGGEPMPMTQGPWHYAPACAALRDRGLAIAQAVQRHGCTTAVVDVSSEVTVLSRLLGLRTIALRQSGRRADLAHATGFASADVVWVPQHPDLEPLERTLEHVDERWVFTGAFSRFDDASSPSGTGEGGARSVVMMVGAGGHSLDVDRWRHVAAPAGWTVTIAGGASTWSAPGIHSVGVIDPVDALLSSADVVITSAGWSAVADVVALGCRLVVVAEDRPFDEQGVRAERLAQAGLCVYLTRWPEPAELADVLQRAEALDPRRWRSYYDGMGAERAAAMIDRVHAG